MPAALTLSLSALGPVVGKNYRVAEVPVIIRALLDLHVARDRAHSMHFVTAANYKFKDYASACTDSLTRLGYRWTLFDLGNLGAGIPFFIDDQIFQSEGYYNTGYRRYPSRAMHKPDVIKASFALSNELTVYMDADTVVRYPIDEVESSDFDLGVTVRREAEQRQKGKVNAGVMFFRPTRATKTFVDEWKVKCQVLGNDQEALNLLLSSTSCKVAEFSGEIYNWYYFPETPPVHTKILHYRASMWA